MDNPADSGGGSGTEIQLNPPAVQPTTITQTLGTHNLYNYNYQNPNYCTYYSQFQNPIPINPDHHHHYVDTNGLNTLSSVQPAPPGVDPPVLGAAPAGATQFSSTGYDAHQLAVSYWYSKAVGSASASVVAPANYQIPDTNRNVALPSYGVVPSGAAATATIPSTDTQKPVTANPGSILQTNQKFRFQRSSTLKKTAKKIKILQSAWCDVCRLDCNSKNVLDQHKLGKKHKKNLAKLIMANASVPGPSPAPASLAASSTVSYNPVIVPEENPVNTKCASDPVIGPQENPVQANSAISKKGGKKGAEDLETKRKKVLEGGAAVGAVRQCAICNVVCNSEIVFRYHLAGQKHAAMLKKHANAALATGT